jgi:oxygen-dependent protoporphyrinogen oxidase
VHGETRDAAALDAEGVVLALPAAPAARLLSADVPAAAAELAAIDYASIALVTLVWRRTAFPPVRGSGYLVPAVEGRPVKAVTFASAKWPQLDTGDVVAVRCSFGRAGEVRDLQRDDDDLVAEALAELRLTTGVTVPPVATLVTRWGGALPQYAVGHLDRVARIRSAVAAAPGLAVCGAAYDGVGIPACIRSAQRAAAQLVAGLPPSSPSATMGA